MTTEEYIEIECSCGDNVPRLFLPSGQTVLQWKGPVGRLTRDRIAAPKVCRVFEVLKPFCDFTYVGVSMRVGSIAAIPELIYLTIKTKEALLKHRDGPIRRYTCRRICEMLTELAEVVK